jgi:hypothetical protein
MIETKQPAIALSPMLPGSRKAGAGFLVRKNGHLWLVTAAHVACGAHPHRNWAAWPSQLAVVFGPESETHLGLFIGVGATRAPGFMFGVDPATGSMSDFMFISINPPGAANEGGPLGSYRVYDVAPPPRLTADEPITGFGFPAAPDGIWPYMPPARWTGAFQKRVGDAILAEGNARGGFSGGPVINQSGQFIGMCIGANTQPDGLDAVIIVAADYLWKLLPDAP